MKSCHSNRWTLFLLMLIGRTIVLLAQDTSRAVQVTTCQLENHPEIYDHKLVQVRGQVYFGKFNFNIDSDCKAPQGRVWLDFGGDLLSPSEYWGVLSWLPKEKGQNVQVRGISIPLVHDALLDLFINDVGATRFRKPNGDNCGSECLFYDVTATVRARFFSAAQGGFGIEECCHLLVIEKVIQVSSQRNRVPAGGEFQCTSDRWEFNANELNALSKIPACSLRDDFKICSVVFAKHWGDRINVKDHLEYPGPWMSPDMTLCYKSGGNFIQTPDHVTKMKPGSFVVREACRPTSPPAPASDHIHCDFYRSGPLEDKNAALLMQKAIEAGRETWRLSDMTQVGWLAYQDSAGQWGLNPAVPLRLERCEQGTMAGTKQPWAECTWLSRDDLQEVIVDLHKPTYLTTAARKFDSVPWVAEDVQAYLCRTEPGRR